MKLWKCGNEMHVNCVVSAYIYTYPIRFYRMWTCDEDKNKFNGSLEYPNNFVLLKPYQ